MAACTGDAVPAMLFLRCCSGEAETGETLGFAHQTARLNEGQRETLLKERMWKAVEEDAWLTSGFRADSACRPER